ncbi:MAG: hypothetical protein ACI4UT_00590, partial [Candidatus Enteromonas sp.]
MENLVTIVSRRGVIHPNLGQKSFPQVIHIFHLGKTPLLRDYADEIARKSGVENSILNKIFLPKVWKT